MFESSGITSIVATTLRYDLEMGLQNILIIDLLMFVAGVCATWYFGWSTKDLLWGMWICSLVSGCVFYIAGGVKKMVGQQSGSLIFGIIGLVFGLLFFGLHFGMFHYVQGSILDLFLPLVPDPDRVYIGNLTWKHARDFSMMDTVLMATSRY